jgi:hypothetical protein
MINKMNYYEIDGKRYVDVLPPGVEVICDFCSNTEHPFRHFDAEDIEVDPGNVSEGGWMACKPCETLIEANDFAGLRTRIIDKFQEKFGDLMTREEVGLSVDLIVGKFQSARGLFKISRDKDLLDRRGPQ